MLSKTTKMMFFVVVFLFITSFGQVIGQGVISGVVTDASTGEPIPGANILVEGTTIGSLSLMDGSYEITNVPTGSQTIIVSFVGY